MSIENQLWGTPRIHGERLKFGFSVAQSSIAKYMVKRRGPPSQGWRTFLRSHAPDIAAMDLCIAPTIGFDLLYAFVIVRLDRGGIVWINVTANPTAEWIARQITEASPWNDAPPHLSRDRDRVYGDIVTRRLRAMGIREKPIVPGPLVEWPCRTADRIDPARICRSYRGFQQGTLASNCANLYSITTTSERKGHWIKMRRSLVRFSRPEA